VQQWLAGVCWWLVERTGLAGYSLLMSRKAPLPFDPIEEAARQWARRWDAVDEMRAVTNIMRVQQLVLGELDDILRSHGLTFARYEALVLLTFSRRGSLPLGKMGDRLQVHPTSVTSIVDRLESAGHVVRRPHPTDGRTVLAEITDSGRAVVEAATRDLVAAQFGVGVLSAEQLSALSALLRPIRFAAGDFAQPDA
jgi:DNA-binding MarR family transcriptional regulator